MPEKVTHRFLETRPRHGNVVFNLPGRRAVEDLAIFAEGYHWAGRQLAGQIAASPGYADYEGYPVLFLYRHALELYLKALVYRGALLLGLISEEKINTDRLFERHELTRLMPPFRTIYAAMDWTFDGTGLSSLDDFEQMVRAIDAIDPKSYAFRYPVTPAGDAHLPEHFVANVVSFAAAMDPVLRRFEGAADNLREDIQVEAEARYGLQQFFASDEDA